MKSIFLPVFALAFLCSVSWAQTPKPPNKTGDISAAKNAASQTKSADADDKKANISPNDPLRLTDDEVAAGQAAVAEVQKQERAFLAAANGLKAAAKEPGNKDAIHGAALVWAIQLDNLGGAQKVYNDWLERARKAHSCPDCVIGGADGQTFVKAERK
jgi:hypothetical protein